VALMSDATLGGYLDIHSRPPTFEGCDGRSYSVDVWVDQDPGEGGAYGASLLFVRWAQDGTKPDGHLETQCLARARDADEAKAALRTMTLLQLKNHLDRLIETHRELPSW
jgi:hypothetical protein